MKVTENGRDWDSEVEKWRRVPYGLVALTILLDQFPRNMYRNKPEMYAYDHLALLTSMIASQEYKKSTDVPFIYRQFLELPGMHVENLVLQQRMVLKFEQLLENVKVDSPHSVQYFESVLAFARRHCEIIERFKKFPHRNDILKRESTSEEKEFLKEPNSGF